VYYSPPTPPRTELWTCTTETPIGGTVTEPQEPDPGELVEPEFSDERIAEMQELNTRAGLVDEDGDTP
jgi:hypothetical protein